MNINTALLKAWLATQPTRGEVNDLIGELNGYLEKLNESDRVWKRQLPYAGWGSLARREMFRDIMLNLNSQGISLVYNKQESSDDCHIWTLRHWTDEGALKFWIEPNELWEIHGFKLKIDDENREIFADVSHVKA